MSKYIMVYGSLRKGDYNFQRFKEAFEDKFNYIETRSIEGFDLYDLEVGYPGIKRNPISKNSLFVDIINVSNLCYEQLDLMEIYAGYQPYKIDIELNNVLINCTIYIYLGEVLANNQIQSGDWIQYINKDIINNEDKICVD